MYRYTNEGNNIMVDYGACRLCGALYWCSSHLVVKQPVSSTLTVAKKSVRHWLLLLLQYFQPDKTSKLGNGPSTGVMTDPFILRRRSDARDDLTMKKLTHDILQVIWVGRLLVHVQETFLGTTDVAPANALVQGNLSTGKLSVQFLGIVVPSSFRKRSNQSRVIFVTIIFQGLAFEDRHRTWSKQPQRKSLGSS
jgi:hypothetical protein